MLRATSAAPARLAAKPLSCACSVPTKRALGVVQDRPVHRTRDAIERELRGRAHVDAIGIGRQRLDPDLRGRQVDGRVHFARRSGASVGHTLSRRRACASMGGVDAIRLEEREVVAEAREERGHERHLALARHARVHLLELARVGGTVVGRNLHAHEHDLGARALRGLDHRIEVLARDGKTSAAQRVVAAELDDHDGRLVLGQELRQPRPSAGGGVAGDRGIDHAVLVALVGETLDEQIDPHLALGQAVPGGDRVADHEQHGRFGALGQRPASLHRKAAARGRAGKGVEAGREAAWRRFYGEGGAWLTLQCEGRDAFALPALVLLDTGRTSCLPGTSGAAHLPHSR